MYLLVVGQLMLRGESSMKLSKSEILVDIKFKSTVGRWVIHYTVLGRPGAPEFSSDPRRRWIVRESGDTQFNLRGRSSTTHFLVEQTQTLTAA
jgi:hypothetical protein